MLISILMASCGRPPGIAHGPDPMDSVQPTFASLQEKLFIPQCVKCHSGPKPAHKISYASYDDFMKSPLFPPPIIPGVPENSSTYKEIRDGKMPKKGKRISKKGVDALYTWIKNGARKDETEPLRCD